MPKKHDKDLKFVRSFYTDHKPKDDTNSVVSEHIYETSASGPGSSDSNVRVLYHVIDEEEIVYTSSDESGYTSLSADKESVSKSKKPKSALIRRYSSESDESEKENKPNFLYKSRNTGESSRAVKSGNGESNGTVWFRKGATAKKPGYERIKGQACQKTACCRSNIQAGYTSAYGQRRFCNRPINGQGKFAGVTMNGRTFIDRTLGYELGSAERAQCRERCEQTVSGRPQSGGASGRMSECEKPSGGRQEYGNISNFRDGCGSVSGYREGYASATNGGVGGASCYRQRYVSDYRGILNEWQGYGGTSNCRAGFGAVKDGRMRFGHESECNAWCGENHEGPESKVTHGGPAGYRQIGKLVCVEQPPERRSAQRGKTGCAGVSDRAAGCTEDSAGLFRCGTDLACKNVSLGGRAQYSGGYGEGGLGGRMGCGRQTGGRGRVNEAIRCFSKPQGQWFFEDIYFNPEEAQRRHDFSARTRQSPHCDLNYTTSAKPYNSRIRFERKSPVGSFTDWNKCFICQEHGREYLCSPSQDGCDYGKLAEDIIANIINGNMNINLQRVDNGRGVENTLRENRAKYHQSCKLQYKPATFSTLKERQRALC